MTRVRPLLLAEAANPEWVSVPLVGWSHAAALLEATDGHLVTQIRNAEAISRSGLAKDRVTFIDTERVAAPLHRAAEVLRGGKGKGWTTVTAIGALSYPFFERYAWRRFEADLRARRFDVVHRITPVSPTTPSPIAARCRAAGVPFVLGPINGGVPWPREFGAARREEREWLSYVRGLHRLVPGYGATRRNAAAILTGSLATLAQVPRRHRGKCVFLPENGVDETRFSRPRATPAASPLTIAFVGRLVPYKCADVVVEAAAPFLRDGRARLDVIGDGPDMQKIRDLAARLGVGAAVRLDGWVDHAKIQDRITESSVFAFPSVREFGGGVVLEAMALGLAPIVADYAGPSELVDDATGVRVPLAERPVLVASFRDALARFVERPSLADEYGRRARERVLRQFTWKAKAAQVMEAYRWARGERGERPDFGLVDAERLAAAYAG